MWLLQVFIMHCVHLNCIQVKSERGICFLLSPPWWPVHSKSSSIRKKILYLLVCLCVDFNFLIVYLFNWPSSLRCFLSPQGFICLSGSLLTFLSFFSLSFLCSYLSYFLSQDWRKITTSLTKHHLSFWYGKLNCISTARSLYTFDSSSEEHVSAIFFINSPVSVT